MYSSSSTVAKMASESRILLLLSGAQEFHKMLGAMLEKSKSQ